MNMRSKLAMVFGAALVFLIGVGCYYTSTTNVDDTKFSPKITVETDRCDSAQWQNNGTVNHTATSNPTGEIFGTGDMAPSATSAPIAMPNAGTFGYHDDHNTSAKGAVQVPVGVNPPSVAPGDSVNVSWSEAAAGPPCGGPANPGGTTFDAQVKKPGAHSYTTFAHGVTTNSASYTVHKKGTYLFRARIHWGGTSITSGWSPTAKTKVS